MICFYEKGIDVIKNAFAGANKGIICTPYYTERGLKLLDPFFDTADEVEFWTRLNPLDWRDGVADMEALKSRVQSVVGRHKKFALYVSNDLHAKIYSFSNNKAIIGSANLTLSAMTTNIETICELTDDDTAIFLPFLSKFRPRLKPVPVDVFLDYVDVVRDVIMPKPFEGIEDENDEMIAAINLAEETLAQSPAHKPIHATSIPSHLEMQNFKDYCRKENSTISNKIIERIEGLDNLQGHVKQCFYGAVRFFSDFPGFVAEIAATPRDSMYDFTEEIRTQWRYFLREHENEVDTERELRFRTLIIILPPSGGGTRAGGGGAISTLKRVFPVVARMIQESGKKK